MKIIAIIGSPKGKGSGYKIIKMIEDRMKRMGEVEFEYIFLKDESLKSCIGCYNCMAKGEDKCPLKDNRSAIEQKLLASNGVILSSPVYVANISGLMKNFLDRFAYTNHRPRFHRQKVLTVVNMAGTDKNGAQSALRWALGGSKIVHELAVATPPWLQTERAVAKKELAIDNAAKNFYQACRDTSLPLPTFNRLINFFIYQRLSSECRQYLPADYAFYNDKDYYYDTNINPIKAAAAKAAVGVMMNIWRNSMGPGNIQWPMTKKENH